jgi:cysteine sulfinate desulfinase/cysteine desulfurase-like protein
MNPDNQQAASSVRSSLAYGSTTHDLNWAIEADPQILKETRTWS